MRIYTYLQYYSTIMSLYINQYGLNIFYSILNIYSFLILEVLHICIQLYSLVIVINYYYIFTF